jgi:hypothetical protein
MINKTASSEIFNLYAQKMISKRASAGIVARIGTLFSEAASALGDFKVISNTIDTIAPSIGPSVKSGLTVISEANAVQISKSLDGLVAAAHVSGGPAEEILKVARASGYSLSSDVTALGFLDDYATDLKKMSDEYKLLFQNAAGNPTDAELLQFAKDNKKTITFFNEMGDSGSLKAILKPDIIEAGSRAQRAGRSGMTMDEIGSILTPVGRAETLAKNMSTALKGWAVIQSLVFWGAIFGGGYWAYHKFFSSGQANEQIQPAIDAIGCIKAIRLTSGSAAEAERDIIIKNLEDYAKLQNIPSMTDKKEILDTFTTGSNAATQLLGNGSGSIPGFIAMISNDPSNLDGIRADMSTFMSEYRPDKSTGAIGGAVAGGVFGAFRGGWIGGILGAALGGLAGWFILGSYYEEEITCLGEAANAIKDLDGRLGGAKDAATRAGGTSGTSQIGDTSEDIGPGTSEIVGDDVSFLARVLSALRTTKLAGLPGMDFIGEKKLVDTFVTASRGEKNAAIILLEKNSNIQAYINQIKKENPQDITAMIDKSFAKKDLNKSFIQQVLTTIRQFQRKSLAPEDKLLGVFNPGRQKMTSEISKEFGEEGYTFTSLKNNLNNLNKTSESINNQEFIRKAAETRVSYFGDANLGLKDQLTKSYYAGLTGMYNEKPQKRPSDYKDLYGFQEETGEDLVLQSHPKSVTVADAMGKGGLVENGLEQKEKSTYVALSTPSGNFQSKYASTIGYLQKLAKAADEQGKKEVSRLIKQTIQNLK